MATKKEKETKVVYTKFITLRNGKRLYAHECGKQVFRFEVPVDGTKKGKRK